MTKIRSKKRVLPSRKGGARSKKPKSRESRPERIGGETGVDWLPVEEASKTPSRRDEDLEFDPEENIQHLSVLDEDSPDGASSRGIPGRADGENDRDGPHDSQETAPESDEVVFLPSPSRSSRCPEDRHRRPMERDANRGAVRAPTRPAQQRIDRVERIVDEESKGGFWTALEGLESAGVFVELSNEETARYGVALATRRSMGRPAEELPDLANLSRPIRVDKGGFSPELAVDLGETYLDETDGSRFVLLVTPAQARAGLWYRRATFENSLLDQLFERFGSAITSILRSQPLAGTLGLSALDLSAMVDPNQRPCASVVLDTPDRSLASLSHLYTDAARIRESPDFLLDEELVDGMVARSLQLEKDLGEFNALKLTGSIEGSCYPHSFWTALFGGIYILRRSRSEGVCRDGADGSHGHPGEALIVFNPSCGHVPPKETAGGLAISIDDRALPGLLERHGFVTLDIGLVPRRLRDIENEALLSWGQNPLAFDPDARRRTLMANLGKMPLAWHHLTAVERSRRQISDPGAVLVNLPPETKIKLFRSTVDDGVVEKLLAELDGSDPVRLYRTHRERFGSLLESLSDIRRTYLLRTVNAALEWESSSAHSSGEPSDPDNDIVFL